MQIELVQTHTPEDMSPTNCCACGLVFEPGPALAMFLSDDRVHHGYVCPRCISRGPEHLEERMRKRAYWRAHWARREAEELEQIASEYVEDMPTVEEYKMFARSCGGPRFASIEEANASLGY
jgi:hypothetical protein